jgi:CPA1 family monovalent cation:H+ antiporter
MPALRLVAVMSAVVDHIAAGLDAVWTRHREGVRPREWHAWRERVVVAWADMRGGLSLAAALAIPFRLANGSSFPDRELVIMVAAAVIVASLLM